MALSLRRNGGDPNHLHPNWDDIQVGKKTSKNPVGSISFCDSHPTSIFTLHLLLPRKTPRDLSPSGNSSFNNFSARCKVFMTTGTVRGTKDN